jgi:PilZ domain
MGDLGERHYRLHQRFLVDLEATVVAESRAVTATGRVFDIGLGGAALELDVPLRMSEHVQIRFHGEGQPSIRGHVAWVAWAEGSCVRVGVRFRLEDEEQLGELFDLFGLQSEAGAE